MRLIGKMCGVTIGIFTLTHQKHIDNTIVKKKAKNDVEDKQQDTIHIIETYVQTLRR